MRKITAVFLMMAVFMLTLASLSGCGGQTTTQPKPQQPAQTEAPKPEQKEEPKPVTLKFAHAGSKQHPYHIGAEKFKEIVEKNSGGKIKIEIYSDAQLGSEREIAEGVKNGTIELGLAAADGAIPNWVPEMQVFAIPYLIRDLEHAYKVLDGPIGKELSDKLAAKGMNLLAYWEVGIRHFTNNKKPVKTPADLAGMKIRVQESKVWIEFIKALKAIPTPIPFGELYTALQQGVVDGQENPVTTIVSMKFYEVQKYLTLDGHTYSPAVFIVNPGVFSKLAADLRKVISAAAIEARDYQRKWVQDKEKEGIAFLKDKGVVVTEPDKAAFQAATKDVANVLIDVVGKDLVARIRDTK